MREIEPDFASGFQLTGAREGSIENRFQLVIFSAAKTCFLAGLPLIGGTAREIAGLCE
jgi:hypothetical protein